METKQNNPRNKLSPELAISCYRQGFKLKAPEQVSGDPAPITLKMLSTFSFNCYLLNSDSTILAINEQCAETCGFDSPRNAIGKSMKATTQRYALEKLWQHDRTVIRTEQTIMLEECVDRIDGILWNGLSIKSPLYDSQNKLLGIFGCTVVFNNQSFDIALPHMMQIGWLKPTNLPRNVKPCSIHDLTSREQEILQHVVRGRTAKGIANILQISHRTVEQHIASIKNKFEVNSKSHLIEKVIVNGY